MTHMTTLLAKRLIMEETWILTLDRKDLEFTPGQYIHLSPGYREDRREYSIYSPVQDDLLEVVLKRQKTGAVSPRLCDCPVGSELEMEGPCGSFTLSKEERNDPVVMVATGSGISPFASLVRSYPGLEYQILHGLPYPAGQEEWPYFQKDRYTLCASRSEKGDFQGRVTDLLNKIPLPERALYMLCGNSNMIYDCHALLRERGIQPERIKGEIYF